MERVRKGYETFGKRRSLRRVCSAAALRLRRKCRTEWAGGGIIGAVLGCAGIEETIILKSGEYVPEDLSTYWFNQDTVFEGNEDLAEKILEDGKNSGLNVQKLHEQGITGENITVAIIDQPLLPDHPEYRGKIEAYNTVGLSQEDRQSSMHGPAVASLLAGDTVGTAPGVNLYYAAVKIWDRNAPEMGAEALDWLIGQNEALP